MYEKEIFCRLCELHDNGKTYEEIAKMLEISKSMVSQIIGGQRPIKNPSLDLFLKVFPHAVISLDGGGNIRQHGGVGNVAVTGNGNNFLPSGGVDLLPKITEAVMSSDLPPDAKVKVYQLVAPLVIKK